MSVCVCHACAFCVVPQAYRASNLSIRNQYVMDLHHMFVEEALGVLRRTLGTLRALDTPEGMVLKVGPPLAMLISLLLPTEQLGPHCPRLSTPMMAGTRA